MCDKQNWLEIFPFFKWSDKVMPTFHEGQKFRPKTLGLHESETVAPNYLSERDLITEMDKNEIGTDATIAEHVKNIQEREYALK